MNYLVVIPARGGSKGVPRKNIKLLNGIPLIYYTIQIARELFKDEHICVSTDNIEIKNIVEKTGLKVPFLRPPDLAKDISDSEQVILHALSYFEKQDKKYDAIIFLQPTSPFRTKKHVIESVELYNSYLDMVVSVKISKHAGLLFKENNKQYLERVLPSSPKRRQDMKKYYEYNGAVYVINTNSIKNKPIREFEKVKKYIMDEKSSIDIDTLQDFKFSEFLVNNSKG